MTSTHYQGSLYRALNPRFASTPLSTFGAERYGGRFNRKGFAALYTAISILGAIREANQVGSLQPTTLVHIEADVPRVFDARTNASLSSYGLATDDLASPTWRDEMGREGMSMTQRFADRLYGEGFCGMLVPSYAPGANPVEPNLIIWDWKERPEVVLTVIDDEGRLGPW